MTVTESRENPVSYIVLQKDNIRYTFDYNKENKEYHIDRSEESGLGASVTFQTLTEKGGMAQIEKLRANGFASFRNPKEVSWYATVANNTPYPEDWQIENGMFIPINSASAGVAHDEEALAQVRHLKAPKVTQDKKWEE